MAIIQIPSTIYIADTQAETLGKMFPGNSLIYCTDTKTTLECKQDGSGFITLTALLGAPVTITAPVTVTANAETIIIGGLNVCKIPKSSLNIGTTFRITIIGSFTGTATATAIRVRLGAAGTTIDNLIQTASITGAIGTSQCKIMMEFTFRTVGAATSQNGAIQVNQIGTTGLSNAAVNCVVTTTTASGDNTIDGWLTVSMLTAASGSSGTVQNAFIELVRS